MDDKIEREEGPKHPAVQKFCDDFFNSKEPLMEVMLRLSEREYIRMSNLDFDGKNYILVN